MKHVKSLALCLLALALVLALAGCGGGKSDLPGTYKIDLDLAPALNSAMTQLGLAEEDLADLTLPVPYTLTLGEDGYHHPIQRSEQDDREPLLQATEPGTSQGIARISKTCCSPTRPAPCWQTATAKQIRM